MIKNRYDLGYVMLDYEFDAGWLKQNNTQATILSVDKVNFFFKFCNKLFKD